jgi:hypothetical protein
VAVQVDCVPTTLRLYNNRICVIVNIELHEERGQLGRAESTDRARLIFPRPTAGAGPFFSIPNGGDGEENSFLRGSLSGLEAGSALPWLGTFPADSDNLGWHVALALHHGPIPLLIAS